MKKIIFLAMCLAIITSTSTAFADAIGPEFPERYYEYTEVSPVVYIIIAVIIVATACIVSVLINKKKNAKDTDACPEKLEEKKEE